MPAYKHDAQFTGTLRDSKITKRASDSKTSIKNEGAATSKMLVRKMKPVSSIIAPDPSIEKLAMKYSRMETPSQLSSSSSSSSSVKIDFGSSSTTIRKTEVQKKVGIPSRPILGSSRKTLFPSSSVVVGWKKNAVPVGSGFVNLGNTCYLNSTLQLLFHVPAFVNWISSDVSHYKNCEAVGRSRQRDCLICIVSKTLENSSKMTGLSMKPSEVYSKLRSICKHLQQGRQEDAHEFLRYLLEGMERSYLTGCNGLTLDNLSKETTPIGQIFGGYLRSEVVCLECRHTSTTFQHFQDIILDIQIAESVEQALHHYFAREQLGDGLECSYKCEKCERPVRATKQFFLERAPKVLCIQLKRFEAFGGKNNKHITFKKWIDLGQFLYDSSSLPSSALRYKLVAMVNHLGSSSSCGHYTAIGLTSSGSYYLFDDASAQPISLKDVLNTNPYILTYELHSNSDRTRLEISTSKKPEHSKRIEKPKFLLH